MENWFAWSEEELNFLKEYYPHKNNEILREKLREINLENGRDIFRTEQAIMVKAHTLGLLKTDYYKSQLKRQRFLKNRIKKKPKKNKPAEFQNKILNLPQSVIKKAKNKNTYQSEE